MSIFNEVKQGFNNFTFRMFKANWLANTKYQKGQRIKYFDMEFECIEDHISSNNFENDSKYWKYPSKMSLIK